MRATCLEPSERFQAPRAAAAALALMLAGACSNAAPPPAQSWPAGTVLAINGEPVSADEVDNVGSLFAMVEPADSMARLRRLALTNVIIPERAARTIDAKRRAEMRARAESYREALLANGLPPASIIGPIAGPSEDERRGGPKEIGFAIWQFAQGAEIGAWSPVIESPGAFEIARVKKRTNAPTAGTLDITIGVLSFPYVDPANARAAIEEAIDRSRLVVVDESWREYVPTLWIHRMRGDTP
jgi:hypothetical protein